MVAMAGTPSTRIRQAVAPKANSCSLTASSPPSPSAPLASAITGPHRFFVAFRRGFGAHFFPILCRAARIRATRLSQSSKACSFGLSSARFIKSVNAAVEGGLCHTSMISSPFLIRSFGRRDRDTDPDRVHPPDRTLTMQQTTTAPGPSARTAPLDEKQGLGRETRFRSPPPEPLRLRDPLLPHAQRVGAAGLFRGCTEDEEEPDTQQRAPCYFEALAVHTG